VKVTAVNFWQLFMYDITWS